MDGIRARRSGPSGVRLLAAGGGLLLAMAFGAATAYATDRWVNDNGSPDAPGSSCSDNGYNTVQDAIDDADEGDSIKICRGTYVEQLTIDKSLKLKKGEGDNDEVIIKAPDDLPDEAADLHSIVTVMGSGTEVKISGLTIRGPVADCASAEIDAGILVTEGAFLRIKGSRVLDIRNDEMGDCHRVAAIRVGGAGGSGELEVIDTEIEGYQGDGIRAEGNATILLVEESTIVGEGGSSPILQYGIFIGEDVEATVEDTEIERNVFDEVDNTDGDSQAAGVIIRGDPEDVRIRRNDIHGNEVNIFIWEVEGNVSIRRNDAYDATRHGIWLLGTNGNEVEDVEVKRNNAGEVDDEDGNEEDGIRLEFANNNSVARNNASNNGEDGISLIDSDDNEIEDNTADDNGNRGIALDNGSDGNDVFENSMHGNDEEDAFDDDGDNDWEDNDCGDDGGDDLCD